MCLRTASSSPPLRRAVFISINISFSFSPDLNIQYLKTSCQKALDILRVVGHTDWGADRIVLLRLYCSLVRSKLDYGCIVYGSARRSILKELDPIHHQGLRITLGAFRTSPAQSRYIEAHEPSLTTRRLKLSLNYVLKLKSLPEKTQQIVAFLNPKTPNYLKNRSQRFHLLASAFSTTWRNPNLT